MRSGIEYQIIMKSWYYTYASCKLPVSSPPNIPAEFIIIHCTSIAEDTALYPIGS